MARWIRRCATRCAQKISVEMIYRDVREAPLMHDYDVVATIATSLQEHRYHCWCDLIPASTARYLSRRSDESLQLRARGLGIRQQPHQNL
jgi:hypothetical protein